MAVTQKKENENQESRYPSTGYQGLAGVSNNTAAKVGNAQQGYQPNQATQQAQAQLQQVQAQKPQTYNSKYSAALDDILNQIQNPDKFNYSFEGDELFKYYADLYSQNGRQGSMDAMGQAAALTGGYGNSYAQQVGNQAYNEWMRNLYDKGFDLRNAAYQQHRDELGDLKDQYSMLAAQDQTDYGRYRDTVSDWQGERDYWTGRADTEEERGYQQYLNNLDYWTGLAKVENADYRSEQERQEAIRQYEQNYAEQVREYNENLAEQKRGTDLDEAYRRDTLDWNKETSQRDYDRAVLESDRNYDRGVLESDRAYNLQRDQFDRSNYENDRDYDRSVLESDRNYNRSVYENDRDYDRNVLESDRNYELQKAQMDENIRQFNESLNWDKMSSDQKYAAQYALAILENGQMPGAALLQAAGLSAEDAAKLMAQLQQAGTSTTGGKNLYAQLPNGEEYVQVDEYGNVKRDKNGNLIKASEDEVAKGKVMKNDIPDAYNQVGIGYIENQLINNSPTWMQNYLKNKKGN